MNETVNNLVIKIILLYQSYISPHKGFCCAHSSYTGRSSCSNWAIRVLRKHKILVFVPLMIRRFKACQMAYEKLKEKNEAKKNNEGFSDCPCANRDSAYCCLSFVPIPWS